MRRCACRELIAATPPQPAAGLMHFDTAAQEAVNERPFCSRTFDREEAATAVPCLIHKKMALRELREADLL